MPVLLRAASSPSASAQPEGFAARRNSEPRDLSLALSAQGHGDFPRSVAGSELPVCALRSRASPASPAVAASSLTRPAINACLLDCFQGNTPCTKLRALQLPLPKIVTAGIYPAPCFSATNASPVPRSQFTGILTSPMSTATWSTKTRNTLLTKTPVPRLTSKALHQKIHKDLDDHNAGKETL